TAGVLQDLFEQTPHAEIVAMPLVVINVATRQRSPIEVPHQRLVAKRQRIETVGVQLDDGGFVDLLEQVRPLGGYSGRSTRCPWTGISTFHPSSFVILIFNTSWALISPCTR